jgi:hypothetical protein
MYHQNVHFNKTDWARDLTPIQVTGQASAKKSCIAKTAIQLIESVLIFDSLIIPRQLNCPEIQPQQVLQLLSRCQTVIRPPRQLRWRFWYLLGISLHPAAM